jgi:aryl-alcohol dehydrogenase-like predicted oxidoreductase
MRSVRLGRTGLPVSRVGLGTATFGSQCDEPTSRAILDRAAELGVTFLDTADKYPLGGSVTTAGVTEEILGRWLAGRRDRFVVATKVHGRTGPSAWDAGLSRRHVLDAVEGSLRRLRTDFIDLYQLHRPDPLTPIEETLAALDALVTAGKVRYVGVSNFLAYQLARALGRSDVLRLVRFVSAQPRYNLLFRQPERELLPLCREEGLAVFPYNLLAGGLLAGKHDPTREPAAGTRYTLPGAADLYRSQYWQRAELNAVGRIAGISADAGVALPTLAAAWVFAQPDVTGALVGASSPGQLDAVLAGADLPLGTDVLAALDEATATFRRGDAVE